MARRFLLFVFVTFNLTSLTFAGLLQAAEMPRAEVNKLGFAYDTTTAIKYMALSGDGRYVAIIYSWYTDKHESRLTRSLVGGTSEEMLIEWDGEALGTLAISEDGGEVALTASSPEDGKGFVYVGIPDGIAEFYPVPDLHIGYAEINFNRGAVTFFGGYFETSSTTWHYLLRRYNVRTGIELESIDMGNNQNSSKAIPSFLADAGYLFYWTPGPLGAGLYYQPSPSTGAGVSLIHAYPGANVLETHEQTRIGAGLLALTTDGRSLSYYAPILSQMRTIFTMPDDQSCTVCKPASWMEMGLESEFTFLAEPDSRNMFQVYGPDFPQQSRYFNAEDLGLAGFISPAYSLQESRTKNVSTDGTRILVQVNASGSQQIDFMVAEVTDTVGEESDTGHTDSPGGADAGTGGDPWDNDLDDDDDDDDEDDTKTGGLCSYAAQPAPGGPSLLLLLLGLY
jgi:hypothetical protein